jgi:hypothetical protein
VKGFAGLAILGISGFLDFFIDPVNKPSAIRDWKPIVGFPTHSKVITQQEEWLKHDLRLVFRRYLAKKSWLP